MPAEKKQVRSRAASHRQQAQPPRKDVVLSAMLAQITICLILLALAYCMKISGLPLFESARAAAVRVLGEQLNFGSVDDVIRNWNIQLPVWVAETEVLPPEPPEVSTEAEPPAPEIDSELAGYIEEYLPEESALPAKGEVPPAEEKQSGQGGGFNFVRSMGANKRLSAPATALLSPFFVSEVPSLPIKLGTLTCGFGYRKHPVTGKGDFHTGVDIAAPEGAPISAVLDGVVTEVGTSAIYGNYIVVRHSMGLETAYCHCSELLAPMGAAVRQREVIARVGSTGVSTGNHVHLEFRVNGLQANPAWVYNEF